MIFFNHINFNRFYEKDLFAYNPANSLNKLVVKIESVIGDKVILIITDVNGRELCKESKQLSPGSNVVGMNQTGGLSKGNYILTIIDSQQSQSIKIVNGN